MTWPVMIPAKSMRMTTRYSLTVGREAGYRAMEAGTYNRHPASRVIDTHMGRVPRGYICNGCKAPLSVSMR